jgi:hypothetical protein
LGLKITKIEIDKKPSFVNGGFVLIIGKPKNGKTEIGTYISTR